ncbi:uncharacterized protein LOC120074545 [Benincasa hispida]|uniref:uncharacterized protein LOC120074545 n=1 Tax=Benincasa hispida TaxID=102211 RepID=UPI0019001D9A|nr:uncharacterized protein LOC120074545 [Benincasa hispida]
MDQLHNCFDPNILGLADMSLLPPSPSPHNTHAKVVRVEKKGLEHAISEEEMKIRREIENEIERDLEEEIKGGIYQHALRLNRLYQHRKISGHIKPLKTKKDLLEVNISIKMDGGTMMEIRETKKVAPPPESLRPRTSRSDTLAPAVPEMKRLDWAKSLRSSAAPPFVRRNVRFDRNKMAVP